jgi:glucose/arabinose dehydrogenase
VCLAIALAAVPASAQLRTQVVAQGLSSPVAFIPDPTSATRFFIVEQGGLIRVLDNGVLLQTPFLDLRPPAITFSGEQGLLGMAFAPDAVTSGRFFVNFTSPNGDIVVARFRRSTPNAASADASSRFDLVWPGNQRFISHPEHTNHNGGHLVFGPDGYLYVGTGDGGSGNDPDNNAQDPLSLLGKMLRIDVNVPDGHATGYRIPPDNPFLAFPQSVLGEIWAFGLRNPWRYTFDDIGPGATGALVIGDVGQGQREEVDYEPADRGGRNYGWSVREGTIATPGNSMRVPAYLPLTNPLFDYPRTIGRAVTGGYVYRGSQLPAVYQGRYFVSDAVTSIVASVGLRVDASTREASVVDAVDHTAELGGRLGGVVSFGRDRDGEIYLVTFAGRILKIVGPNTPAAPAGLTATVGGRTVQLQWTPPAGAAVTGYRLEAGSAPGASNLAVFNSGPTPALGVSDVPDGTYYVRVRGVIGSVAGPPSNEVQVVVAGCPVPTMPAGPTRAGAGSTVVLNWPAAAGATGYRVEAGSGPGLANLASIDVSAALSLTTPAPDGVYFVRVRALNGCGLGPPSTELVVTVP